MKLKTLLAVGALAVVVLAPASVYAHFVLMEPASWLVENALGDPQKSGPCGGQTGNPGTPTNVVTEVVGGSTVHIKVKETIYHPGFYRVALSVLSRDELPPDPEAVTRDTPRGPYSVSGKIEKTIKLPFLADGLFEHHTPPAQRGQIYEADVKLPNINCAKCSMQIIQFMEEHGENKDGRFTYHHCADFKIVANKKLKLDKGWPGQGKAKK